MSCWGLTVNLLYAPRHAVLLLAVPLNLSALLPVEGYECRCCKLAGLRALGFRRQMSCLLSSQAHVCQLPRSAAWAGRCYRFLAEPLRMAAGAVRSLPCVTASPSFASAAGSSSILRRGSTKIANTPAGSCSVRPTVGGGEWLTGKGRTEQHHQAVGCLDHGQDVEGLALLRVTAAQGGHGAALSCCRASSHLIRLKLGQGPDDERLRQYLQPRSVSMPDLPA